MPVLTSFSLPGSPAALSLSPGKPFFIAFLSSNDPQTNQPWCPDVRAALPVLDDAFSANSSPDAAYVEVGQRPEWREPTNVYRTQWNVHNVPTLVRYENNDNGLVNEVGRLIEGEILDQEKLRQLIAS